ncbi:MAG: O-antigen/teichoic acid export membrane protein [Lentimonas sp.]|jgi:O-antigen/teichoic acid export membrane protein
MENCTDPFILSAASVGRIWRRLRQSVFIVQLSQLLSGEVFAQALGFAVMPLMTRLYGPAAFGILGVFFAVSEVLGRTSTLRYDLALVLPEKDVDAWPIFKFTVVFALVLCSALLLVSHPFRASLSGLLGSSELAVYFPLMALMALGIGWQSLASYWVMREKHFKVIAYSSSGSAVIGNAFKVVAGLLAFSPSGLLLGTVLQRWSNLILILILTPSRIWKHKVEAGTPWLQAKKYREFPLYRMPQDTINSFTRQLPAVIMASFFSPAAAGIYLLAWRALTLPVSLLNNALRKVFYMRALDSVREGRSLFKLSLRVSGLIFVFMLPAALFILFFGERLFVWVFGHEWAMSGQYAKWIFAASVCTFGSLPAQVVIPIIGWNAFFLVYEIVSTFVRLGTVVFVASCYDAYSTVVAISATSAASSLFLFVIVMYQLYRKPADGFSVLAH